MKGGGKGRFFFLALMLAFSGGGWSQSAGAETALDRYLAQPDPDYGWSYVSADSRFGFKTFFLKLTSQRWRSEEEVDRTLWEHELIVTIPERGPDQTALMLIDGGSNTSDPILESEDAIGLLANALGMVVVVVRQVPNQPLAFADEGGMQRREDEILSYSMDRFLDTGDETWPVHLAMTKSAVRAMDAVQDFMFQQRGKTITDFVLLGGSKRGWTTWLTAATDDRVKGIIPVSADLLNLKRQFRHHWGVYGFYTPAINDYEHFDLNCRLQTRRGQQLSEMIDPYYYRDRLTMPKLIVNSTGDQFFVTDSARYYYDQLPGPKRLRNTFNTDHRQGGADNLLDLLTEAMLWVDEVNHDEAAPDFSWNLGEDGSVVVNPGTGRQPTRVKLWSAHNPDQRDFRLESLGAAWSGVLLNKDADGLFRAQVDTPEQGYVAYSVELEFDESGFGGLLDLTQVYTTEVKVLPDVEEYQDSYCLAEAAGVLENPAPGSGQSGIGLFSGWSCADEGLEVELDDARYLPLASGTTRKDTLDICGDTNNGLGALFNFNLLGDGRHAVRLLRDGREIDRGTFDVTRLGADFLRGVSASYRLPDFPSIGQTVELTWEQSLQNFVISGTGSALFAGIEPANITDAPRARLENPADGSPQSGVGLFSGWVCEAERVELEIDGERLLNAAYGTLRNDTRAVCGDSDNGFGLLYNFNLLGDGEHEVRLLVDGVEQDRARIKVVRPAGEFLRGVRASYQLPDFPAAGQQVEVRWDQSRQNFLIDDAAP